MTTFRVNYPHGVPPVAAIEFALLSEPTRHEEPALGFRFESEDERTVALLSNQALEAGGTPLGSRYGRVQCKTRHLAR